MTNTRRSLIGITIAVLLGATALIGFSQPDGAQTVHEAPAAVLTPSAPSPSTKPVSSSTAAPVAVQPVVAKGPSKRAKGPSSSGSTTTTSEVPPPLTPSQEAIIPGSDEEIAKRGDEWKGCDPDRCEHMSNDGQAGEDFNLPSETETPQS